MASPSGRTWLTTAKDWWAAIAAPIWAIVAFSLMGSGAQSFPSMSERSRTNGLTLRGERTIFLHVHHRDFDLSSWAEFQVVSSFCEIEGAEIDRLEV